MMRQRRVDRYGGRDVTSTYTLAPTMIPAAVDTPLTSLTHPLVCGMAALCDRRCRPVLVLGGMQNENSSMYRRLVCRSG